MKDHRNLLRPFLISVFVHVAIGGYAACKYFESLLSLQTQQQATIQTRAGLETAPVKIYSYKDIPAAAQATLFPELEAAALPPALQKLVPRHAGARSKFQDGYDADVEALFTEVQEHYKKVSLKQKQEDLSVLIPELKKIDPEEAEVMAAGIERALGIKDDRAYEPRSGTEGTLFDPGSMAPYDIVVRKQADGTILYDTVWVDKNGSTLVISKRPQELEFVERIFLKQRGNPQFEALYRSAVKLSVQGLNLQSRQNDQNQQHD